MTETLESATPRRTAVVIGGSIGGSATAAALREHYDRVLVIDRDELPSERKDRKGAPHAYQFHAMTHSGREALESLLPGFTQTALDSGVPRLDPGHTAYASKCGFFKPVDTDMLVLLSTRIHLETLLRAQARDVDGIDFRERQTVTGLRQENGVVTGVEIVDDDQQHSTIDADFVVDCSGRSSEAPAWLEALGYPVPEETVINARWGYVTTYVRPGPGWNPGYKSLYVSPTVSGEGPKATRGGGTWAQEDGIWVLTAQGLGGPAGDYPPGDEAGFREFLASFGRREFTDLLDNSEIVKPLVPWRNTTNRLRDYANLASRPENFVVIGDAVAAFNPVYGQGMSAASMQAALLRDEMRSWLEERSGNLKGFGEHFQKAIDAAIIQGCWAFSAGTDLGLPGVEVNGEPHHQEKSQEQLYVERVLALATEDEQVARKVVEMIQIARGPEWMSEPDLQAKITENWDRLGTKERDDSVEAASYER